MARLLSSWPAAWTLITMERGELDRFAVFDGRKLEMPAGNEIGARGFDVVQALVAGVETLAEAVSGNRNDWIDEAYRAKYRTSTYLSPTRWLESVLARRL